MKGRVAKTRFAIVREFEDPVVGDLVLTQTYEVGTRSPFRVGLSLQPRMQDQERAGGEPAPA